MSAAGVPVGLGPAGSAVWLAVIEDLASVAVDGERWELDGRERLVLEAAARQADLNRALEEVIADAGLTVIGSTGQTRLNPAATELRQGRVAFEKLVGSIALPGEDGIAQTTAQKRAKNAAAARWGHRQKGAHGA
jgi:hypothetical protein